MVQKWVRPKSIFSNFQSEYPTKDAVVASQCRDFPDDFKLTARFWSQHYAMAPGGKRELFKESVKKLKEMGFEENQIISSLSQNNWNYENTVLFLIDQ